MATGMEERNGLDDYWLGAVCCAHYPSFMEDVLHAKGVARRRKVLRGYSKTMQKCASGVLKGGSGLELEGSVDMEQVKHSASATRICSSSVSPAITAEISSTSSSSIERFNRPCPVPSCAAAPCRCGASEGSPSLPLSPCPFPSSLIIPPFFAKYLPLW